MTQDIKLENLRTEKERFVAFSFAAADLLIELDNNGVVIFASGAAKGLTGVDMADLKGMPFVDLVAQQDKGVLTHILDTMNVGDRITPVVARMEKTKVSAIVGACKLPRNHEHVFLALNVSSMAAARSSTKYRDNETGLLDRQDFLKLADQQLAIASDAGQRTELTLLHLNGLSALKESVGDDEMNGFLDKIGILLRRYSLGGDAAGRLDDDKYGLVHSPSVNGKILEEKISTLTTDIDPKANFLVQRSTVDLSKGQLSANNATQALMYVINRFVDSDQEEFNIKSLAEGMDTRLEKTMNRMLALKSVFQNYKFKLVYQPIVKIADKEVHHYEVLSRFKDGESPYETVVFAEETGIIQDLDLGVAQKAKDKLLEFQKRGDVLPKLAINISGYSLESNIFIDNLLALYADNDEIREHVGLEVTETSRIKDLQRAENIIQTLRETGMEISLDDMGSGSASFQYIRAMTVDYIKIDGTYIKEVLTNKRDAAILKALSRLCQELDIGTIAEMVETKEQLHVLNVLGVNYGQGWYFGKPQQEIETKRKSRSITKNLKRKGFATSWS
ncbi:EAL domain-containing protein [Sneathiella sp. HT1-7]|uniref:sensor domain-containing phosphodiesterase n=1 Tax=Sneathiella sp. HT1-7 TaxID=2887192 RepID=UPI001D135352|nr:GGDEF domain-containing phosphodiesterase [Sneathiella sp. HT1-7]MCC3305958.1 EAL domain-containing protein [Sneathiella sp. HT1-7]